MANGPRKVAFSFADGLGMAATGRLHEGEDEGQHVVVYRKCRVNSSRCCATFEQDQAAR